MAALFRPLLTLPSASNPCSNSAVKVVRTCPLKKSSVNQRFLRPVICDLSMAAPVWRIPVGHLQFWALSSISCYCDPISAAVPVWLTFTSFWVFLLSLAGLRRRPGWLQYHAVFLDFHSRLWIWISTRSSCVFLQRSSSVMIYGHFTLKAYM